MEYWTECWPQWFCRNKVNLINFRPQRTKYSSAQLPCTLRPSKQCSPSQVLHQYTNNNTNTYTNTNTNTNTSTNTITNTNTNTKTNTNTNTNTSTNNFTNINDIKNNKYPLPIPIPHINPQGPCCDRDCRFNVGNQCREDNGCRDESYCDGRGTGCPPSILKPNKTVCNEEFVCFQVSSSCFQRWCWWCWCFWMWRVQISPFLFLFKTVFYNAILWCPGWVYWIHLLGLWAGVLSVSPGSRG